MLQSAASHALNEWRGTCQEMAHRAQAIEQGLLRWEQMGMVRALEAWMASAAERRVLLRMARNLGNTVLARAFRTWLSFLVQTAESEQKLRRVLGAWCRREAWAALNQWRDTVRRVGDAAEQLSRALLAWRNQALLEAFARKLG